MRLGLGAAGSEMVPVFVGRLMWVGEWIRATAASENGRGSRRWREYPEGRAADIAVYGAAEERERGP